MSKAYFSPSSLTFIPEPWKEDGTYTEETWPSDAVLLTEEVTNEYWKKNPPIGKKLGTHNNSPYWQDVEPPTEDELNEIAENNRASLLSAADAIMLDWRTELQLGSISDEDRAKLYDWLKYKKDLKSAEPNNWPPAPER